MGEYVESLIAQVKAKNPAEPEFHQAVLEVVESLLLGDRAPPRVPGGQDHGAHGASPSG